MFQSHLSPAASHQQKRGHEPSNYQEQPTFKRIRLDEGGGPTTSTPGLNENQQLYRSAIQDEQRYHEQIINRANQQYSALVALRAKAARSFTEASGAAAMVSAPPPLAPPSAAAAFRAGATGNSMETPSAALRDARMRLVCTEVFTYHSVVITRFDSSWVDDLIVSSVMPCVELR